MRFPVSCILASLLAAAPALGNECAPPPEEQPLACVEQTGVTAGFHVDFGDISEAIKNPSVSLYEAHYDNGSFVTKVPPRLHFGVGKPENARLPTFEFDPSQKFQTMRGFGASLTEACTMNLMKLPQDQRRHLLNTIFRKGDGAGFDMIRLPVGASDFADGAKGSYSYDDSATPDPEFHHFDMSRDEKSLAILREAHKINPDLGVLMTPWSAPAWMKTTNNLHGGTLAPEHYQDYANYLAKVSGEYKKHGVPVETLTIENEPWYSTDGYPSMELTVANQEKLIGEFIGPTLQKSGDNVKIFGVDHNWDLHNDANALLSDSKASPYIAGAAYHCYGGNRWDMVSTMEKHPDKEVMQTECTGTDAPWTHTPQAAKGDFQWWLDSQSLGAVASGTTGALGWNLCLDEKNGPQNGNKDGQRNGGCTACRGMVKIDFSQPKPQIVFNPEFNALAQVSKFVYKGARRVALNGEVPDVQAVAFVNPNGQAVVVARNTSDKPTKFNVRMTDCRMVTYEIAAGVATTFTWMP